MTTPYQSPARQSLSIIGVGAFGTLIAEHLAPHFDLTLCDPHRDLEMLAKKHHANIAPLSEAVQSEIIILAIPIQNMKSLLQEISTIINPHSLVIDVASVKMKPIQMMKELLPPTLRLVGTHPLFGPQSGKYGIQNLNIAICPIRGHDLPSIRRFCRTKLHLHVFTTTADDHDQEMAYVQGLTHLVSKIIVDLDLPHPRFPTKSYELLKQMVSLVRHDSDALFRAIEQENPFVARTKNSFFESAHIIEKSLQNNDK